MNRSKDFTILIVDDNENNLYSLDMLLKNNGYRTIKAEDGHQTLKILMEDSIDLIILDVQLPDYNGFHLASMIRKKKSSKSLPIILASAVFKAKVFVETGFEAGALDYVLKPINSPMILSKVAYYRSIWEERETQLDRLKEKEDLIDRIKLCQSIEEVRNLLHE